MAIKLIISFTAASVAFVIALFVFNFAYVRWAIAHYPQHNSMAGMAAFYYGLPVAAAFAIIGFAIAFRRTSRINAN
jgi:hypothetical protein